MEENSLYAWEFARGGRYHSPHFMDKETASGSHLANKEMRLMFEAGWDGWVWMGVGEWVWLGVVSGNGYLFFHPPRGTEVPI